MNMDYYNMGYHNGYRDATEKAKAEIERLEKDKFMFVDKLRDMLMDIFIKLCNGNDYNKLTLLKIGDTVDCIYDNLVKEMVGENNGNDMQ